jgi:hypothetical protein
MSSCKEEKKYREAQASFDTYKPTNFLSCESVPLASLETLSFTLKLWL